LDVHDTKLFASLLPDAIRTGTHPISDSRINRNAGFEESLNSSMIGFNRRRVFQKVNGYWGVIHTDILAPESFRNNIGSKTECFFLPILRLFSSK
jgi:hypothetical protein